MTAQGLKVSIAGVAQAYESFLDALIVDDSDSVAAQSLNNDRLHVHCTNIMMRDTEDKTRIARTALALTCPGILSRAAAETR